MTVLLLSTHMHWWLSYFSHLIYIDDCPTSLNSQALMTVLLLSTYKHWWLSYFSQLTGIDDCPTSINSHTLMTVLLLSTHIHWWLSYFSQLTCIARWPACRPSPCVTSAGWSASGSSPTCCPPPPPSIRHSAARAPHETCPKWLSTFTILILIQATQAHVQSIYLPLHSTLSSYSIYLI